MEFSYMPDVNLKEVYKLHTGLGYDSDDSLNSEISVMSEMLKPPLYSFEELNKDLIVIEPNQGSSANSTVPITLQDFKDQCLKEKLADLEQDTFCKICSVDHPNLHNANEHYCGRRHQQNLDQWIETEYQKYKNNRPNTSSAPKKYSDVLKTKQVINSSNSVDTKTLSNINPSETSRDRRRKLWKTLKSFERLDVCKICNVNYPNKEHYTGRRHRNKASHWFQQERLKYKISTSEIPKSSNASTTSSKTTYTSETTQLKLLNALVQPSASTKSTEVLSPPLKTLPTTSTTQSAEKSSDEILKQRIKGMVLPNYCYICVADLEQPINARSHYNSNRHKYNLKYWKERQLEQIKLSKKTNNSSLESVKSDLNSNRKNISSINNSGSNVSEVLGKPENKKFVQTETKIEGTSKPDISHASEILKEKLKLLILPNYCYICEANLENSHNADSHYNSKRHKVNLQCWKDGQLEEIKILEGIKKINSCLDSIELYLNSSKKPENNEFVQIETKIVGTSKPNISHASQIIEEKLKLLVLSNYCYICQANLEHPANVTSHYNSKRHEANLQCWKKEQLEEIELSKKANNSSLESIKSDLNANKKNISSISSSTSIVSEVLGKPDNNEFAQIETKIVEASKSVISDSSPLCTVCNVVADTGMKVHFESDLHKQNLKRKCQPEFEESTIIGEKQLESKLKLSQRSDTPGVYTAKTSEVFVKDSPNTSSGKLSSQRSTPDFTCTICDIKIYDPDLAKNHFETQCHKEKSLTHIKVPLQESGASNQVTESSTNHNKVFKYFCYLCPASYTTPKGLDRHVQSYPHCYVQQLKSSLVACGIIDSQYWSHSSFLNCFIQCNICESQIFRSQTDATPHFNSKKHKAKFKKWLQDLPKDFKNPERRRYYCDICSAPLDGTINAEAHYEEESHKRLEHILKDNKEKQSEASTNSSEKEFAVIDRLIEQKQEDSTSALVQTLEVPKEIKVVELSNIKSNFTSNGKNDNIKSNAVFMNEEDTPVNKFINDSDQDREKLNLGNNQSEIETKKLVSYPQSASETSHLLTDEPDIIKSVVLGKTNNDISKFTECSSSLNRKISKTENEQPNVASQNRTDLEIRDKLNNIYENKRSYENKAIENTNATGESKKICENELDLNLQPTEDIDLNSFSTCPDLQNEVQQIKVKNELLMEVEKFMDVAYFSNSIPAGTALQYVRAYNRELTSLVKLLKENNLDARAFETDVGSYDKDSQDIALKQTCQDKTFSGVPFTATKKKKKSKKKKKKTKELKISILPEQTGELKEVILQKTKKNNIIFIQTSPLETVLKEIEMSEIIKKLLLYEESLHFADCNDHHLTKFHHKGLQVITNLLNSGAGVSKKRRILGAIKWWTQN